jgi:hypothetical protein
MTGVFIGAWAGDSGISVRVAGGLNAGQGYVDTGRLGDITDSSPALPGETDNYVMAVSGYGFEDGANGLGQPLNGPVYAGIRRPSPIENGTSGGCKAYLYGHGFTPDPGAVYPQNTAVPGALNVSPACWVTLPEDRLALAAGAMLYLGQPGMPTQRATLSNAGYTLRKMRGMAMLNDGKIALAAQVTRNSDSAPCIIVSAPVSVSAGLPASVDLTAAVYVFDGANPWKAALSALCIQYQGELKKAQAHRYVNLSGYMGWAGLLARQATPDSAQFFTLQEQMYNTFPGASPNKAMYQSSLTYSEAGGVLSYGSSGESFLVDGNAAITAFDSDYANCQGLYADSDDWAPPEIPLFWKGLVKTIERP